MKCINYHLCHVHFMDRMLTFGLKEWQSGTCILKTSVNFTAVVDAAFYLTFPDTAFLKGNLIGSDSYNTVLLPTILLLR